VTVLWIKEVHTDREAMANRPDVIIKNRKINVSTSRRGNTSGQKYLAKGSRQ
jgi:hypothetical protein